MISKIHHYQVGVHATRLSEDLQREIWGFAQAVIDEENQQCANNRMNYWKSRLTLSVEHAKAKGMDLGEIAHQCQLTLCAPRGIKPLPGDSLGRIESYLQSQGVPAKLQAAERVTGLARARSE
jgi:hypothetical protein